MADWPTQHAPLSAPGEPSRETPPLRSPTDAVFTARSPSFWRFANPLTMWRRLWTQRGLIWQFTVRDVQGRYRGSFLGLFWSFFTPLLMLSVYTFVFGYVFNSWQSESASASQPAVLAVRIQWVLKLFCGLIVFGIFSECVSRAPGLIVGVPNYVKKVVFPLEVLPVAVLGASLIHATISMGLLVAALLVFEGRLSLTISLFPLVLVSLVMMTMGIAWFLASLGVFVRDVGHAVGIAVTVLFFMSVAIFDPLSTLPEPFRALMLFNPLAGLVEDSRRTLVQGSPPNWPWWGAVFVVSAVVMQLGYMWFMKSKRWFSDVI